VNDFTKEELLIILNDLSAGFNKSQNPNEFYASIIKKVTSLIDNYCEYDTVEQIRERTRLHGGVNE